MTTSTLNGMASRGWAFLACRVLALYLFYLAIDAMLLVGLYSFAVQPGGENARLLGYYYLFRFLLAVAGGVVLWFGAARLAGWMVPRQAHESEAAAAREWNVTQLLSLAVSVLGLVLVILAIPEAASLIARYLAEARLYDPYLVEITTIATSLVLGILLILGSRGIANVIKWARRW